MNAGEFPDGSKTLRAKIDMASPNLNMRDPVMYRILHEEHHRQGGKWCIYPMYDWAHGFEDSLRGHHAFALLAGIREPPPALRLVHRRGERPPHRRRFRAVGQEDPPPPPDRVRAAEHDLHGHVQAQAAPAGRAGLRQRLRRPAHADAFGHAAAGLSHPRRSASSASGSASTSTTAPWIFNSWSTACARTSTRRAPRVMARAAPAEAW